MASHSPRLRGELEEGDRRLAALTYELRNHRGDWAAEVLLWKRIDAQLDRRLRCSEKLGPAMRW